METTGSYRATMDMLDAEGLAHGMSQDILDAYLHRLQQHIAYVQEACRLLGGVTEQQIDAHDLSKFTMYEFPHYARQFHGPKNDPDGFAHAWLHHIHHNPHHWQYWIFPDGYTPKGSNVESGVVQMPLQYVAEMVADWMGANKAYTGSWDLTGWLISHLPKIRLHSQTKRDLETILGSGVPDYGAIFAELAARSEW